MAINRDHRFSTARLLVNEWHSFSQEEWPQQNLADVVVDTLSERVTKNLPPPWQGSYTVSRANQWIIDRDGEGVTLLVVNKVNNKAIGLVILFELEGSGKLRLGYLLDEASWGKGFASELIAGFVDWCRRNEICSITGGVERDNVASRRVLEKCGFVADKDNSEPGEQLFRLVLR